MHSVLVHKLELFALLFLICIPCQLSGVTIHVPVDFPTITEAVNNASSNDTIQVASGTYIEPDLSIHEYVHIISETGEADCATIFGSGGQYLEIGSFSTLQGFTIFGYTDANILVHRATLRNLVITSGGYPNAGMGMYCINTTGTWENLTVVDNRISMVMDVGGIFLDIGDDILEWPTITRCIFAFNEGYGVRISLDAWFYHYYFNWDPPFSASNIFGNQLGEYASDTIDLTNLFGLISSDPLFVDLAAGEFELMPGSPCLPDGNFCRTQMGAFGETDLTAIDDQNPGSRGLSLLQNYPNPFNPSTRIDFYLGDRQSVSIAIYDATGRQITELLESRTYDVGYHSVTWQGTSDSGEVVASGIYFVHIKTPLDSQRRKMLLLK